MASDRKPNILVVSDPPAAPGYLPRLRYLCDYLTREGYAVTLLTEEYQPLAFEHHYPIETIRMYSGGTLDWLWKTVRTIVSDWHNRAFAEKALRRLLSDAGRQPFDMVLCTAFSDFPLGAAKRIAEAYHVPLLCDIRDLDEQVKDSRYQYHHQTWWTMPFRRLYRAVHIRRRNRVLRQADAVTTISPWHVDFIRQFNPKTYLVYNGFDEKQFYPEDVRTDRFNITYIGSLFEWQKAALEQVREAIAELAQPEIQLDIHTPQHQCVSHEALGDTIRHSSIMMVFTSPQTHGMLTTKFYEALGCEKPILCVPSDQGTLAKMIAYTNSGIATDDIAQIKAFIAMHYAAWKQQGFTRQATQHREEFSRACQCRKMEQIIQTVLPKKRLKKG